VVGEPCVNIWQRNTELNAWALVLERKEIVRRTSRGSRLIDYREVDEKFDRIVSVGMFEHVGQKNYETFFQVNIFADWLKLLFELLQCECRHIKIE